MRIMTGFIGMALLLATTSCVSAEKVTGEEDSNSFDPFLVTDGRVNAQDIAASLKLGQRVIVMFEEFKDSDDNRWSCPVKLRTVDDVCQHPDYQNIDPSVICRRIGDPNPNYDPSLRRIKWKADMPFTVTFPNLPAGVTPCKDADWDGETPAAVHICKIKKEADLSLGAGDAIFLKYDIRGEDERCDALDPYFIIRK